MLLFWFLFWTSHSSHVTYNFQLLSNPPQHWWLYSRPSLLLPTFQLGPQCALRTSVKRAPVLQNTKWTAEKHVLHRSKLVDSLSPVNHSGLQQGSNTFHMYYAHKSSNNKFSKTHKISPNTNLLKQNIHKHQTQNFQRISPFGIDPVKKKHTRLGHAGIVDHSIDLKKKYKEKKKEWTEAIKKIETLYKCITTNISAIWQHNAHATD